MIEVLLFSFSISIDAFGYAMGFGTRNIKLSKLEFLVLNLVNTTILSLLVISFSYLNFIFKYPIVEKISAIALIIFGIVYIIQAFKDSLSTINVTKNNISKESFNNIKDYFKFTDFALVLTIFIFENAFSSLVFHSSLSNAVLFIFSNFVFHYLFFIIGFDLGAKIVKKININTSFISGFIFLLLGIFNF